MSHETPVSGGRRRAAQAPGSRRRESTTLGYLPPVREPRFSPTVVRRSSVTTCVVLFVLGSLAASTAVVATPLPDWVSRAGAVVLVNLYAVVLTYRAGGRLAVWPPLVVVLTVLTLVTDLAWALSMLAVVTGVLAAVLAVVITRPAVRTSRVVGEFAIAVVIGLSGGLAVAAWNAPVVYQRFNLLVLALSLVLTFAIVWSLGAGLHGLGQRGFVLIVGGALLMTLVLAYSSAVRAYGSPVVVDSLDSSFAWLRDTIGGVPRPAQFLLGLPALVWGIGTRADRRQGWWMCAFGVVGTATMTTQLVSTDAMPVYIGLSELYSIVLGLLIGLLVRRLDPGTRGASGARARRDTPETVVRPEPERTRPLK
ncbi:hypothetical protein [Solicola sp. PLA-1-18]|uniref:hypothetical protein n=1 Tax=Solicola sp. PLA-1-18 TaxID=3380532 RepID=UPI003B7B2A23